MRNEIYDAKMKCSSFYRDCVDEIPFLQFEPDWLVQITPPFGGAVARFRIRKGDAHVSVYADFDNSLGCMDVPYWEVYPFEDDVYRCMINETEDLLRIIKLSIDQQCGDSNG